MDAPLPDVELYRLLHTGNEGDLDFYLHAAEGAERILELGAGWGRLAVALAARGHDVTAVELEPRFVELGREGWEKARDGSTGSLEWLAQDLREFGSDSRFDRVFLPYNTLYALGGLQGVRRAFEIARRHLAADGEIWFDVYRMDDFHQASLDGEAPADEDLEWVARVEHGGHTFEIFERTALALDEQRLDVTYEARNSELGVTTSRLQHHYLLTPQLVDCLTELGLEIAVSFADFHGHPFDGEPPPNLDAFVACAVPAVP